MSHNRFSIQDKIAIVTGASSGLGQHFAHTLAQAGAKVVLGARRIEKLNSIVENIQRQQGDALALSLDVTDKSSIDSFLAKTIKHYGQIDILVNNAGVAVMDKTFFAHDEADWDLVLNTNLKGVWMLSQAVIQHMLNHKIAGSIINISSAVDHRTRPPEMFVAYNASKAGVSHLTRALAAQFASDNIRVNAIAPGWFVTEMTKDMLEENGDALREVIPMQRFGQMQDLDGPLLLLASDASSYMSGAILRVDGGVCTNNMGV